MLAGATRAHLRLEAVATSIDRHLDVYRPISFCNTSACSLSSA